MLINFPQTYAVKEFTDLTIENWKQVMSIPEVRTMRKLNHPNIITLKDVVLDDKKLHLVFELMESNIHKMLKTKSPELLVESNIKIVLYELLKGLKALHEAGFVHGNIKPSHIFIQP